MAGYVAVTGSLAAARKAFGVTFGTFKGPDKTGRPCPRAGGARPPRCGATLLSVTGLDTAAHDASRPKRFRRPGQLLDRPAVLGVTTARSSPSTSPTAYGGHQPWTNCGYTPRQIRGAYGVTASGMTGKGQTVAVVDAYASPTMLERRERVRQGHRRPAVRARPVPAVPAQPFTRPSTNATRPGWYGEETLDVEAVHGQAPDANVDYVGAASCDDADLADALTRSSSTITWPASSPTRGATRPTTPR